MSNQRPRSMSEQEAKALQDMERLIDEKRRPMITCLPNDDDDQDAKFSLTGSRFGGRYAWPKGKDLPFGNLPEQCFCLAQINLSTIPSEYREGTSLPGRGIFQAFVRNGESDADRSSDDGFLVVIHDEPSRNFDLQPSEAVLRDTDWQHIPLGVRREMTTSTGIPMTFGFNPQAPPSSKDYQLEAIGSGLRYAKDCSIEYEEKYDALEEALWDEEDADGEDEDDPGAPCWLWGHPNFTQEDIRHMPANKDRDYLSLISFGSTNGDIFMFGDAGTATIMMPSADLEQLEDFSRAIYSWDCP